MPRDCPWARPDGFIFAIDTQLCPPIFNTTMTLRLTAILAILLPFGAVPAQNTVGTIAYDPDLYTEGYTMIYPHNQNRAMLLNACGEVVHDWTIAENRRPGNTAYLQPNGDIIMTSRPAAVGNDPIWAGGGGATIERRTWNNEVLWSFTANNDSMRLHHDFTVTPQGNVIAICWEVIDSLECIENGRDPALLDGGELWSDKLIELQPDTSGGADIVWEWRVWDHLVQDYDSTKANYGVVADNQHLIDLNFGSPSSQAADWLHMNAIDYFPFYDTAGQIIMSVPTFNEVWVIWHDWQFNDNLIWRWGNPEAYQRGDSADQKLFYQHDIHWGNGLGVQPGNPDFTKFFVFNNRVPNADTTGTHSEAAIISPIFDEYDGGYEFNTSTGRWGPEDFQWTYTQPGLSSTGLSSFQRLGNGGNLICNGRTGELFEITEDGELAWEYRTPLIQGAPVEQGTELQMNNNLTFRADRYPLNFPAFAGQDLSSGEVIEINPTPLEACGSAAVCGDPIACNYGDEGTCEYVDADAPLGTVGVMMLGLVDPEACGGYEVYDDGFVTLVPGTDTSGHTWSITPEIATLLVASGFQVLYDDLLSQTLSVCGSDMTVVSGYSGDTTTVAYDGTGWVWPLYGGYTAPVVNFEAGCGDPEACNFNPCALADDSLCTALEAVITSDDASGFLQCEVSGGTPPYEFILLDGNQVPTGIEGGVGNLSLAWTGLPDGAYCIEVVDAIGCGDIFCDTLGVSSVVDAVHSTFVLLPNPASGVVRLSLPEAWAVQSIVLRDAAGREVLASGDMMNVETLDVGGLRQGTYLVEVLHLQGRAVQRLVVRR